MYRYIESDKVAAPVLRSVRLLDQLRERIRYLHYSLQTEKAYLYWARFFIRWHGLNGSMRHPKDMGKPEVEAFLTMLANERQVSPSTHRQALNALLFLYKQVIGQDLSWLQSIGRPPERKRVPVVLTVPEVESVLVLMEGVEGILARLLYGTGMRLAEGLSLRVKDVDFDRHVVIVRSGKGDKDRVVMLPKSLVKSLTAQLAMARSLWAADRAAGRPGVFMPHALDAKYPRAGQSWAWHWVFPSKTLSIDPRTGVERRHHLFEERLGRKLKMAVEQAGISKHVTVHTLRHYSESRNMPSDSSAPLHLGHCTASWRVSARHIPWLQSPLRKANSLSSGRKRPTRPGCGSTLSSAACFISKFASR